MWQIRVPRVIKEGLDPWEGGNGGKILFFFYCSILGFFDPSVVFWSLSFHPSFVFSSGKSRVCFFLGFRIHLGDFSGNSGAPGSAEVSKCCWEFCSIHRVGFSLKTAFFFWKFQPPFSSHSLESPFCSSPWGSDSSYSQNKSSNHTRVSKPGHVPSG